MLTKKILNTVKKFAINPFYYSYILHANSVGKRKLFVQVAAIRGHKSTKCIGFC